MKFRFNKYRGVSKNSWLDSRHSFSFSDFVDEKWTEFGQLRVFNEDWIAAGSGFPMHPHRDMEIITIMLKGELRHRDSMGHEESLLAGEVQAMTAGKGILHSEWNPSSEETHLFQLWIKPTSTALEPRYEQFSPDDSKMQVLASNTGGGLKINANAEVIRLQLNQGELWTSDIKANTYVHIIKGELDLGSSMLYAGDAVGFEQEAESLSSVTDSEILLINMY
jgi:redox-sensitive bicupin YhaK (pirin superfamily)